MSSRFFVGSLSSDSYQNGRKLTSAQHSKETAFPIAIKYVHDKAINLRLVCCELESSSSSIEAKLYLVSRFDALN